MSYVLSAAIAALVFAPLTSAAAWYRRRTTSTVALLMLVVGVEAVWLAAFAAVLSDYRDAEGFVDCYPHCTTWQDAVGVTLWVGPIFAALATVAALAALFTERAAGSAPRRARGSGPPAASRTPARHP